MKVWKIRNTVPEKGDNKVPGCHGGGLVRLPLPAGRFGSLTWCSFTRLISVGPGCVG